jgi:hypothetical protein
MPRTRHGGIGLPDDEDDDPPFDVTFAVEADGDDDAVVDHVAIAARDAGVRALQAFRDGTHPDDCDGIPMSIDWDRVLAEYDDTSDTNNADLPDVGDGGEE